MAILHNMRASTIVDLMKTAMTVDEEMVHMNMTSIVDFHTLKIWEEMVPKEWHNFLEDLPFEKMGIFMDFERDWVDNKMPADLQNLREKLRTLQISRKVLLKADPDYWGFPPDHYMANSDDVGNGLPLYAEVMNPLSKLHHFFFKKIKSKKRHEIMKIVPLILKSAAYKRVQVLVDVGSGTGHLARILTYCCNRDVLAIEGNQALFDKSETLDNEFVEYLRKNRYKIIFYKRTRYSNTNVDPLIYTKGLSVLVNHKFLNMHRPSYGIIGLHPCGNLAVSLLRMYRYNIQCKSIILSSCCYHKITCDIEDKLTRCVQVFGFPLAKESKLYSIQLNRNERQTACHALERVSDSLKRGNFNEFKIHSYRSVLNFLIHEKYPEKKDILLANVKFSETLTFKKYCELATANSRGTIIIHEDRIDESDVQEMLADWKKVLMTYFLQQMYAPLLESIMLLDRYAFCREMIDKQRGGFSGIVDIRAIFDPRISPRNHVLVSYK